MLKVNHLSKSYGVKTLFSNVNFTLNTGERLGMVGPNGCGKTTLLRLIAGEEIPDEGSISITSANVRVGYLPQGLQVPAGGSIRDVLSQNIPGVQECSARLTELADQICASPQDRQLASAYDAALNDLQIADEHERALQPILAAFQLNSYAQDTPVSQLSGGQKTRLMLAAALAALPQLLLLDEPTNHLDIAMLEWLENWIRTYRGAAIIVSHDRVFLDRVATGILELDPQNRTSRLYPGNYSDYAAAKQSEMERQLQDYQNQQDEIGRLRLSASHLRGLTGPRRGGKADSNDKFAKGFFANRSLEVNRRAKQMEARIEKMLTEDHIEKPRGSWQMKMEFGGITEGSRDAVVLDRLSCGYPGATLISDISLRLRHGDRAALIGPNGCGKTTLLRTIAGQIEPLSGTVRLGNRTKLGVMAQEQENLNPDWNALVSIQNLVSLAETEARAFLSMYLFKGDDVFIPAGNLSFGQRARLTLACLVAQGCNLLLLDEPLNHLDIPSRAQFEQALISFDGAILTVTHDRYFVQEYASVLWRVEEKRVIEERVSVEEIG
jgi:ATP-binding cassette subfamily F protein 3